MGVEIQVAGQWKEAADRTPVGVIVAFGGTVPPDGWFLCNGDLKSRATNADLYAVIGTAFGAGDGTTTFALPDLRGRFLRGRDGGAGKDPDAASRTAMATGGNAGDNVGSVQTSINAAHNHYFTVYSASGAAPSPGQNISSLYIWNQGQFGNAAYVWETNSGGNESRPINAAVNYIIKY